MAAGQKKKAIRFTKRALKVARFPGIGRGSGMSPISGELPVVILRVQILGGKDLLAKDKGGTSDPYVHDHFVTLISATG